MNTDHHHHHRHLNHLNQKEMHNQYEFRQPFCLRLDTLCLQILHGLRPLDPAIDFINGSNTLTSKSVTNLPTDS